MDPLRVGGVYASFVERLAPSQRVVFVVLERSGLSTYVALVIDDTTGMGWDGIVCFSRGFPDAREDQEGRLTAPLRVGSTYLTRSFIHGERDPLFVVLDVVEVGYRLVGWRVLVVDAYDLGWGSNRLLSLDQGCFLHEHAREIA